ncbi:hypothetical protein PR048_032612 [Dryococelus australis]|uniref:Uncharacterized protein n=1 Tax=Dryococelus australis TaxID=614101 RepID=A0ABQ9G2P2_9NEOP|nr:hypothetical protein PR048_032612 [Dryococelus australis]
MRSALSEKSLRSTFPAKETLGRGSIGCNTRQFTKYQHRQATVVAITRHQKCVVVTSGGDTPQSPCASIFATTMLACGILPTRHRVRGIYFRHYNARLWDTTNPPPCKGHIFSPLQCSLVGYYQPATV